MPESAIVLADSISPNGVRLVTMQVTFARIVLSEFNTHRHFTRSSASSRAIPSEKMIQRCIDDPFIPDAFGKNQSGMQSSEVLDDMKAAIARTLWLGARDAAVAFTKGLLALGVHKQITNRLLEPFMWHTVIVTATEYSNFFALRCHPDAQPQIQAVAYLMREAMANSSPMLLGQGQWHLPLVRGVDLDELIGEGYTMENIVRISAGRCARVSYLTHHGTREPQADIDLCERLVSSGHMSPLEHVATPGVFNSGVESIDQVPFIGNLKGWLQLRKTIPNEHDFSLINNTTA